MATKAIDFEKDSQQYAWTPDADLIESHATPFTVEFWYRPESHATHGFLVCNGGDQEAAGATQNWYFYHRNNGKIRFNMRVAGAVKTIECDNALNDGTWYHICGIWDGNEQRLYINGVKQTVTNTFAAHEVNNQNEFYVGKNNHPTYPYYTDGTIDELRVSGSVRYISNFTPSEIEFDSDADTLGLWHFNDNANDSGPNGYHLTEVNNPAYVEGKVSAPPAAAGRSQGFIF